MVRARLKAALCDRHEARAVPEREEPTRVDQTDVEVAADRGAMSPLLEVQLREWRSPLAAEVDGRAEARDGEAAHWDRARVQARGALAEVRRQVHDLVPVGRLERGLERVVQ